MPRLDAPTAPPYLPGIIPLHSLPIWDRTGVPDGIVHRLFCDTHYPLCFFTHTHTFGHWRLLTLLGQHVCLRRTASSCWDWRRSLGRAALATRCGTPFTAHFFFTHTILPLACPHPIPAVPPYFTDPLCYYRTHLYRTAHAFTRCLARAACAPQRSTKFGFALHAHPPLLTRTRARAMVCWRSPPRLRVLRAHAAHAFAVWFGRYPTPRACTARSYLCRTPCTFIGHTPKRLRFARFFNFPATTPLGYFTTPPTAPHRGFLPAFTRTYRISIRF